MQFLNLTSKAASDLARMISKWNRPSTDLPALTRTVVVSCLRNRTWIDWAAYMAIRLRERGIKPVLIYSARETKRIYGNQFRASIHDIPDAVAIDLDVNRADELDRLGADGLDYKFTVDSLAYDRHLERHTILKNKNKLQNVLDEYTRIARFRAANLSNVIRAYQPSHVLLYSGLIYETPAYLQLLTRMNVPVHCTEGWAWRKGHMIVNTNGPALEYDILSWQQSHGWSQDHEDAVDRYMEFQSNGQGGNGTRWLSGFYNVQRDSDAVLPAKVKRFIGNSTKVALLAPNVIGDSSTLNRETIFQGMEDWIIQISDFYRKNRDLKLIVRAHPAESWVRGKVKVKIGAIARASLKGLPNALVIDGSEKVNTFAIEPHINLGLVWMSSIGADLVARGVPVICAASPKYSGLDVAIEPNSSTEYFSLLEQLAHSQRGTVSTFNVLQARKYIYTIFSGFSFRGHGDDFTSKTIDWLSLSKDCQHLDFLDRLSSPAKVTAKDYE